MVSDMVSDMGTYMVSDLVSDMVSDMGSDMFADMVTGMVSDLGSDMFSDGASGMSSLREFLGVTVTPVTPENLVEPSFSFVSSVNSSIWAATRDAEDVALAGSGCGAGVLSAS